MNDHSLVRHIASGLIAFFLGMFLVVTCEIIRANAGACGNGCNYRPLDPNVPWERKQIRENKRAAALRKHYEKKWGKTVTDSYPDNTLARINKNPGDPDCWQYTPKHCY